MGSAIELSHLEQVVMWAIVRLRDNAYGVTIRKEIAQRAGRDVTFGSVYATLDRLERKGMVTSRKGEATAERGGRAKLYFKISALGAETLNRAGQQLADMKRGISILTGYASSGAVL